MEYIRIRNMPSYQYQLGSYLRDNHNIGNGSLLGLGIFALDGILSPNIQDDLIFSKSTKVVLSSILIGLPSGVIGGVIYYIFKKRKRYAIKGDLENWTKFRAAFESNN